MKSKNAPPFFLISLLVFFLSCSLAERYPAASSPAPVETILHDEPARPVWYIPDGPQQTLRERTWNLHHQKLWIRFDFEREEVIGNTELIFTSKTLQDSLVIDAKTMRFYRIFDADSNRDLSFRQDSAVVAIFPDIPYQVGDTLVLGMDFVSKPPNRGLYFVNPRGEDPHKPTQVWTLGQPEDNSFWLPTIDHPAERMTQEVWISVPERYTTLSNGLLLESRVMQGDSLRTDYWRLHQPHAPYLLAIAVGEYDVKEVIEDGILYRYFTEPEYTQWVDLIYEGTADMIRFSEKMTGIPYPWDPVYAQVPVRDFIARGMENTTATILYDAVQFDSRAARDLSNQDLIMHEVIHQWFGNLVTCKDWANLPLNEGFANYFESAYRLYNNGRDEYLWKQYTDRLRYFAEAAIYRRPIIFDRYQIPEDMYDRHTYQKAGQVFRMLHKYLGDEIWWKGVRGWLEKFAFDAVDVEDLRRVFEEVSGKDLGFFVDQWFLQPGHPTIELYYEVTGNEALLRTRQVHDMDRQPLFTLYPEIWIEHQDGITRQNIRIDRPEQEFLLEATSPIRDIIVDPDRVQLAQYLLDINLETLMSRLSSPHLLVRAEAISMAEDFSESDGIRHQIKRMALDDPFWGIRMQAFSFLADFADDLDPVEIFNLVTSVTDKKEKNYRVRIRALNLLRNIDWEATEYKNDIIGYLIAMMEDTSYFVTAEAIRMTGMLFPELSASMTASHVSTSSHQDVIRIAVAEALTGSTEEHAMELLKMLAGEPGDKQYSTIALAHILGQLRRMSESEKKAVESLFIQRLDDPYKRFRMLAYEGLSELVATDMIEKLKVLKDNKLLDKDEQQAISDTIRILEYHLLIDE